MVAFVAAESVKHRPRIVAIADIGMVANRTDRLAHSCPPYYCGVWPSKAANQSLGQHHPCNHITRVTVEVTILFCPTCHLADVPQPRYVGAMLGTDVRCLAS